MKDYVFAEKLGSGTYATVYKAFRKDLSRREVVAVKCVEKSSLTKSSTENLLTEIEILKKLKHANIVQLIDFQWDDKYIYLIMEYCSGGDLSKFIRLKRALPEHLVKRFLQQLALAMQFLRSENISHMDLKPQNILLLSTDQPVLKLADFGFAQYLCDDMETHTLRGSPLYMAPEIIVKRQYNPKADLWSIGVLMYECLFGRAPFASKTYKELQEKVLDSKPIEIPVGIEITDNCRDLVLRLLQRDPDVRIDFDDFFQHPFINLDCLPSAFSFSKAASIVGDAVKKDLEKNYKEAHQLYVEALEHFVAAIHHETDPLKKNALRQKVKEYMTRAEQIKQSLRPELKRTPSRGLYTCDLEELVSLSKGNEDLESGLLRVKKAMYQEELDNFREAEKLYELALDKLIKVIQVEPKGRRKDLLHNEISRWMTRAEGIKSYLSVINVEKKSCLSEKEEAAQEEEQNRFIKQCSIQ
ncbi:serine/threonine-protein kinase ULK3-like isoform X2 [Tubulanus polymorphus]|uniref:serine/threonine-protein kinase ULK3-like isoform X2 n=1 Tax=Tubulanus polymorphus TaxID=672921 RepID=UPI003DA484A4